MCLIPDNIDSNTQVLDMSGNNLQILPRDTFIRTGLVNLQKVYLRNCRLGQIDDDAFNGLTNLIELDLSHNLLTSIPTATLTHIESLRDLTMASNPIQKIESHAFRATDSLTKLDLSHCVIQTIAPEAFKGLHSLHSLKLNGNKLSELRPRTIETLSKLHGVELHDNPWLCDCRLRAAKIWLTENNIPYPVAPQCSGGPERVIDRTFAELNVDDFACRPEIMPVNRFIEATSGENATILCRTSAVPSANVNWYWNGRLLMNNSAFSSYQKVFVFEDGEFEKRSRLVLTNAQETDSSEFYCVADNRAGSAEANFTLHVIMRTAGMASLGSGQIVGLSAALVILILFILLIILFLLVRLRRIPFSESKTPGHVEVITTAPNDLKLTNPVQKPPRLTDISYSTSHYDGNGSIISSSGPLFVSPTASAGNNPDLINDTKRLGSGDLAALGTDTLLAAMLEPIERPGSGEYSRAGCDSLYPSGLWEQASSTQMQNHLASAAQDLYLKRAASTTIPAYSYTEKTPIIDSTTHMTNLDDDVTSTADFLNRTFPRTAIAHQLVTTSSGYPADYGLPIVPGAEHHKSRESLPPAGMPNNAKTLRVWQRGGVPVLPPVTALKRALTSSRNSPDEGYQEGCGTDV
ncbi:Leucine-rich repeat-containing protein 4 [Pseudolycoriella hygida]|uniref:Leucine-rich repeat-containing protein 4 n=1 Tax=Pseudolycoriella hygida TaxID=35572 RepID=A0A9Q0NGE1_9DIPT|nr:Leucine-rich repeat-containing protein 4 [Pseudolycoriella hygida]